MSKFAINPSPLMTSYLVRDLRIFRDDPIVILDVGARGGFNTEWSVFADQIQIYGFEPDEEECRRLAEAAPAGVNYIPSALGRSSGMATLYEAKLAASTSLYETRPDYFNRLLNRDNGRIVDKRSVFVRSLDEVLAERGIGSVDFIKLDAEGAELDILEGGAACVGGKTLLGVLAEMRFHEEINGSPPFAELDIFLRKYGFRLYDLQFTRQSRIALPYPGSADYRLSSGERFFAYTTRGQVQDGDGLYFRDLLLKVNEARHVQTAPTSVLKLCCLMELYSLNDSAAELILANRERLQKIADTGMLLNLLASGIAGQFTDYTSYIENYFSPPPLPQNGEPSVSRQNLPLPQSREPSVSRQTPPNSLFTWLAAKVGRKAD
jgi:FkbM family methyltransferase